jgi:DNA-binding transcriptional ArsR family regulator
VTIAVDVVVEPARAQVLLHPTRLALLELLAEPDSAAGLARRLDLPRQRVNYHLRELETQKLVDLVETKQRGSVTERMYRRTGRTYALSPAALGSLATSPEEFQDRFSAAFQIALASRSIRELAELEAGARSAGKKLPTFAIEGSVRFASPADRSAFAEELTAAVAHLIEKYHDERAAGGRTFRVQLGAYPQPKSRPAESHRAD